MTVLDDWTEAACAELGLDPADVPITLVLQLAKDVAHAVTRPAAPVTAYLLGMAAARGADPMAAATALASLTAAFPRPGTRA
ncbi:hypothetical protein GCM10010124_33420 [Pilimelia terevasa]|uniref:DUF6457 domain-containing protein n=1 Tax=Pilimelia terevasa TaxID=53372 RepID=A0A8J3FKA1_9ACTN|nr:DUF6457 domain-containing protein [Pilimelia terevasa]GGK37909.1 hypothetical protein GCM10010124_33420 [Pilimelia terevasa]